MNEASKKRDRNEIGKSILKAIEDGYDTRIRIMHASFLTDHLAKNHLDEMVKQELISLSANTGKYQITEVGKKQLVADF